MKIKIITFLLIVPSIVMAKTVFVTVPPQAGIVKQISGSLVNVETLTKGEACPETFSPTPKQMESISKADLFIELGMPFERSWLKKAGIINKVKVVSMSKGIKLRNMESHKGHHHAHGHHGETDPHIWTSVQNVIIMAKNTYDALSTLMPEHKKEFEQNLKDFENKAKLTDKTVKSILKDLKNKKMFVFHPYYGYFADSYGLEQIAIEAEGKTPTAKQLAKVISQIKEQDKKVIFTQPEFDIRTARSVAKEAGAELVTVSIYSENVLWNIEEIAKKWKL